jgi:hypothetical protein
MRRRIHACHTRRRIHACHMRRRIHACHMSWCYLQGVEIKPKVSASGPEEKSF